MVPEQFSGRCQPSYRIDLKLSRIGFSKNELYLAVIWHIKHEQLNYLLTFLYENNYGQAIHITD
jgi:hypothetical protein